MWHPVQQNSEEPCPCCGKTWMELRAGKVTGSSIAKVMANFGKAFGDPAKRLAKDIAVVELGGSPSEEKFKSSDMERGHIQEPIAKKLYEDLFFVEVSGGGFYDNGRTGASLDGIVYQKKGIEIKCVLNDSHHHCIKSDSYDTVYKWQIVFELKESGLSELDFISYCSTFPAGKQLFICPVTIGQFKQEIEQIDYRLNEFYKKVDDYKTDIQKYFKVPC